MNHVSQQMQGFFKRLDKAQGENELNPICSEVNAYIQTLPKDEQDWAKEDFRYYFTKRMVHLEDEVARLQYDIYKDKQVA